MGKKWLKIAGAVIGMLLVIVAAAAFYFMDANRFRPEIEAKLSAALARKVTLGDLRFSLLTGSIQAQDLTIAEDPNFGTAPFFTGKQLRIGVEVNPLIFHKKLVLRSIEAIEPEIHLIHGEGNTWNFSSLDHRDATRNSPAAEPGTKSPPPPSLDVDDIHIRNGRVTIETTGSHENPQVYSQLDVKLDHFALAKGFPFAVTAALPHDGTVSLSGKVGAINSEDAAATTLDAQISIKHLDPVAAGYVDPTSGIQGIAALDGHVVSDGTTLTNDGKVHAEHLILLKGGRPAPNPIDLEYKAVHSLKDNSGRIPDLAIHTGAIALHINGTYKLLQHTPVFDMKMSAPGVPVNSLQALLPAIGARLPNGAHLRGGTLSAHFNIKGTPKDNVITGSYDIRNTVLEGYDLGSKIKGIAALAGIKTGPNVAIDESRADMRITKEGSKTTNIYSLLPVLGESTGEGTVSATGQIDFHLISKVARAKGLNKVGVDLLTKLNKSSAAEKPSDAPGIPIHITGTAENPVITADVGSLVKGNLENIKTKSDGFFKKTGQGISKIFHKKPEPQPDQN